MIPPASKTMEMRWLHVGCLIGALICLVQAVAPESDAPAPRALSTHGDADVSRCADCHEEIVGSFQRAPHSFTLRRAAEEGLADRFLGQQVQLAGDRYGLRRVAGILTVESEHCPEPMPIDWVFGSGHHALTPVSTLQNPYGETELFQINVSWFPGHGLGLTPGTRTSGLPSLGLHHSPAEAIRCFTCHSSYVPVRDNRIDFQNLVAGVTCTRCHPDSAGHVRSDGAESTALDWKGLSPLAAINRCGECHRRVDEFTEDELVPGNELLIRFAPVGLALSRCFSPDATDLDRLDCLTCHDPHQPAASDARFYLERCLKCHSESGVAANCSSQPMTSQCLECHMPKVEVSPGLSFTDHWIRHPPAKP